MESPDNQTPTPAATLILMRERGASRPPELLFVERAKTMRFAGGALVFPGGRIDDGDHALAATFSRTPDMDGDEIAARVAAMRETIEEVGIAVGVSGSLPAEMQPFRDRLMAGAPIGAMLEELALTFDPFTLIPFARWCPSHPEIRVFDTRFYLARLPDDAPEPVADGGESARAFWATAQQVLADADAGNARIIFPTRRTLERLANFASHRDAVMSARNFPVRRITPWVEEREGERHLCIPDDLGFPVTSALLADVMRG